VPVFLDVYQTDEEHRLFDLAVVSATGCHRLDLSALPRPDAENYLAMLHRMGQTAQTEVDTYEVKFNRPAEVVSIGLVDDPSMNAFAMPRARGGYWIAVTSGLYLTLTTIYNNIFRHRRLFPDIGDGSVEAHEGRIVIDNTGGYSSARYDQAEFKWEPQVPDSWIPDGVPIGARELSAMSMRQPNDPVRRLAYIACVTAAWDAIIAHEVGHIVQDHFILLDDLAAPKALFEIPSESREVESASLLQALEIEADSQAAGAVWTRWSHSGNILTYDTSAMLGDGALNLRLWFIATNALYWAFASHARTGLSWFDAMSHPHPDVRLSSNALLLHMIWTKIFSDDKVAIVNDTWPAVVEDIVGLRDVLARFTDPGSVADNRRFNDPDYRAEIHERLTSLEEGRLKLQELRDAKTP
jgi:hypothetical protein